VSGFANRTVSFTGDFRAVNNGRIEVAAYGTTIFKGLYSSEYKYRMYLGKNYSATGIIEFHCASNRINAASLLNADIYLKATDALPHTLLVYQNGDANYGKIFLCGNDQSFRGICWESPTSDELATGQCWLSEERPSTVRITGCESNTIVNVGGSPKYVNRLALFGNITLVMDVDPAYTTSGFFQEFFAVALAFSMSGYGCGCQRNLGIIPSFLQCGIGFILFFEPDTEVFEGGFVVPFGFSHILSDIEPLFRGKRNKIYADNFFGKFGFQKFNRPPDSISQSILINRRT
jgi:hypothetical protein